VALGVVGDVDEGSAEAGGELLAAHGARLLQVLRGQRANASEGAGDGRLDSGDQFGERLAARLLRFLKGELFIGEATALGVGQDAVDGAGDMAELGCNRREPQRHCVDLRITQAGGPLVQVVQRKFEGVDHGATHRG